MKVTFEVPDDTFALSLICVHNTEAGNEMTINGPYNINNKVIVCNKENKLKREKYRSRWPRSHDGDIRELAYINGWNNCIDEITKNG